MSQSEAAEGKVRAIRRKTRGKYSVDVRIRVVLEGLRGEDSIAELYRRERIAPNLYYRWSKEFLGTCKRRMTGDTKPQATSGEVRTPLLQISRSRVDDVKNTMGLAITKTGVAGVKARHRPQLLSDHGPCYLAGHLKVMTQSISFDQYSS